MNLPRLLRARHYTTGPSPPQLVSKVLFPAPHNGTITLLLLNRPESRNAISTALLSQLSTSIATLPPDTRALLLASAVPGIFCAGADLKERRTFTKRQTTDFLAKLRATFTSIATLNVPTIAAVSSLALGGGTELALAADFRVVGPTSRFVLPETHLGIIPGAGGVWRLRDLVGRQRALEMVLSARGVGAQEAFDIGLASRVVKTDGIGEGRGEVIVKALEMALEVSAGAPISVQAAKSAIVEGGEAAEVKAYERVLETDDRNEGLRAFAEKRRPVFTGR